MSPLSGPWAIMFKHQDKIMNNAIVSQAGSFAKSGAYAAKISRVGRHTAIYALVLVFGSIGTMKFTAYEAGAIEGLIASSPLLDWLYVIHGQRGGANLIGVIEVAAAALLAVRPWSPVAGAIGAVLAMAATAVTLTFLFTAPGGPQVLAGSRRLRRCRVSS